MPQHLNEVLEYLERHPDDDIDGAIARIAGTSAYHFRHMFGYLASMSLSQYLRNLRLSRANAQLLAGGSVLEAALAAGYESADSFTRAYRQWHGVTPSVAAQRGLRKTFPAFRFHLALQGGISLEYRLDTLPAFNLIGVTARVPLQFNGENTAIAELAATITPAQHEALHRLADLPPHAVIGADYDAEDYSSENSMLTHMIGVMSTRDEAPEDLVSVSVPSLTWAIFSSRGPFPETLQETWAATASQWLPDSGYELVEAPEISYIDFSDPTTDRYSEIWLAVRKI